MRVKTATRARAAWRPPGTFSEMRLCSGWNGAACRLREKDPKRSRVLWPTERQHDGSERPDAARVDLDAVIAAIGRRATPEGEPSAVVEVEVDAVRALPEVHLMATGAIRMKLMDPEAGENRQRSVPNSAGVVKDRAGQTTRDALAVDLDHRIAPFVG